MGSRVALMLKETAYVDEGKEISLLNACAGCGGANIYTQSRMYIIIEKAGPFPFYVWSKVCQRLHSKDITLSDFGLGN